MYGVQKSTPTDIVDMFMCPSPGLVYCFMNKESNRIYIVAAIKDKPIVTNHINGTDTNQL